MAAALQGLLVPHLLPERCYDELFLRFNLLHGMETPSPSSPAPWQLTSSVLIMPISHRPSASLPLPALGS
uniref:Uncharacterized protein n=1 Tax=Chrysemys picta bellii TaxID=8478 RepID=A0A8C3FG33_CHRPI